MREIVIDGKVINDESKAFVICEIGNNHGGSLETCIEMIDTAAECGASAIKLQKRHNRSLYTERYYERAYDNPNSYAPTYGAHREKLELSIDDYKIIKDHCEKIGITFFATAFDLTSADELEQLGVPAYKIASGDLKSLPLIKYVASFGKPIIVSTGGGTLEDVKRVYDEVMPINKNLVILQCTAGYPPRFDQLNLRVIETYRKMFPDIVIGFSSHDNGIAMPLVSYMLGGRVIEKHFTLNRTLKGTDHAFSLEPTGFRKMVRDLDRTHIALGDGIKVTYDCEVSPVEKMSKKLVIAKDLRAGAAITEDDLMMQSPGNGIPPSYIDEVLGKTLIIDVKKGDDVAMDILR